jgi:hypothetical protein
MPEPELDLRPELRRRLDRMRLLQAPWRAVTALAVAVAVTLSFVGPASGAPDPVTSAQSELSTATAARQQADARVADLEAEEAAVLAELERLGDVDASLTEELAEARRALREYAVAAYIDGGQSDVYRATLSIEQAQALAWQSDLLSGQSMSASDTAARYQELKDANSPAQLAAAAELDKVRADLQEARYDAIQTAAFERDAEARLATAQEAARRAEQERRDAERAAAASAAAAAAAERSTTAPSSSGGASGAAAPAAPAAAPAPAPSGAPSAPPGQGNPSAAESATLAKIRWCESRNNYSIVSASGRYRGAYQFDRTTWGGVGGSGDPAAASPAEQDYRALLLLRMRGTRPWPRCGR